jgi:putative PIG3 family NAD(P)H quinone oxidoreductase
MTQLMNCITQSAFGGAEQLQLSQCPIPKPKPFELLIRVNAFALNRADILQRQGKYPPPAGESEVLGLELAGIVVAIGDEVKKRQVGDKVFGLVGGGAYADYCALDERLTIALPDTMDMITAAGTIEAFVTANETIIEKGKLNANETLLIHAGASGVGTSAIQLAKQIGATIIATAGTDDKCERLNALGVRTAINYRKEKFYEVIEKNSIDLIIDFIGKDYFCHHFDLLKSEGRLIQVAAMSGAKTQINLVKLMQKRISLKGFTLRNQTILQKSAIIERFKTRWLETLRCKKIHPIIDKVFTMEQIQQAHQYMQTNQNFGKIVITTARKL